jgi:hypothetical protein
MKMIMDMWRVDPHCCGVSGLHGLHAEPASGLVGYLVAQPADEDPFMEKDCFDIDAYEAASVGVFFSLTRDGFHDAHSQLRFRCRREGQILIKWQS